MNRSGQRGHCAKSAQRDTIKRALSRFIWAVDRYRAALKYAGSNTNTIISFAVNATIPIGRYEVAMPLGDHRGSCTPIPSHCDEVSLAFRRGGLTRVPGIMVCEAHRVGLCFPT